MPLPVSVPLVGSLKRPFLTPAATQMDSSTLKLFTEQNANAPTAASLSLPSGGFAQTSTAISNGPPAAFAPAARALSSAAWIPPPASFSNVMTGFSAQQTSLQPMLCTGSALTATSSQQAAMPTSVGVPLNAHEAREDRASRRRRRRASSKPGSESARAARQPTEHVRAACRRTAGRSPLVTTARDPCAVPAIGTARPRRRAALRVQHCVHRCRRNCSLQ